MKPFLFLISCLSLTCIHAQQKGAFGVQMVQAEERMRQHASDILNAPELVDRLRADSFFTRELVQALKMQNSFSYPFDSLKTISVLYAPDSSFRIFTWQVMRDFGYFRQKGAIQMHTADGSLQLTPLFDFSAFTDNPVDSVRDNQHWIGAVYYNIIKNTYNNRNYYTLFGYDENDSRSTKKWMEVLTFDANNKPQFGGRYFNYPNDKIKSPQPAFRFCLEYKKLGNAKMNYDPELGLVTFAGLISEIGEPSEKYTLVPVGTYEGFKWVNGKWNYVPVIAELDARPNVNPQQAQDNQLPKPLFNTPKKKPGGN